MKRVKAACILQTLVFAQKDDCGLPSCWGCKALPTPIDQLTKNYLGLRVSFARLSPGESICGVTACRAAHSSPISCRNHTSRLFQEVTFFEQTGFLYLY